jgi:excisionase family DNA binding protein
MRNRQLVSVRQAEEQREWARERFVRRLIFEKRIPYHKVGGKVFVDLADLDAYAERGRVAAAG